MAVRNYYAFNILSLIILFKQYESINQCEKRIIGYGNAKTILQHQQASKLTHIVFLTEIDANVNFVENDDFDIRQLVKIKENAKIYPNLKIIIKINMARQFKKTFLANMEQNIKKIFETIAIYENEINGIEFKLNNFDNDLEDFLKFFALFRIHVGKLKLKFLLNIELHPDLFDSINIQILENFFDLADFVNLMAFDYYEPWNHNTLSIAAPFAPLYPYKNGDTRNVDSTINFLACNIAEKHIDKINLGLSFAIWKWTMVEETADLPTSQKRIKKNNGSLGYKFAWRDKNLDINRTIYDEKVQSAYIYDDEKHEYYTFENEHSLKEKIKYVIKKGLRGIAIVYLYYDDDQNTLFNAITTEFNQTCDISNAENFTCNTFDEITTIIQNSSADNISLKHKILIFLFISMIFLCKLFIFFILFERRREKKKMEIIISQLQPYKDYTLKTMDTLGNGNFGIVHLGKFYSKNCEGHEKTVAYKIMNQNDVKITVLKEIYVMTKLYHENICKFYGLYELEGDLCILMEYANLGNLRDYLQQRQPGMQNPPALLSFELVNISTMIAKGLRYLEEKRILHRDLAARNCLVSGNDDHGIMSANMRPPIRVMLSDFGLSKILKEDSSFYQPVLPCWSLSEPLQPTLPLLHQFVPEILPWRHMAPESLNLNEFTFKSEIWSYGMVLFEVFTCETPYGMIDDNEMIIKMIRRGEHPEIPPNLPEEINGIIRKCWLVDPKERISIGEICQKLGV